MGAFERRDDAFEARQEIKGLHGLLVNSISILDSSPVVVICMLGPHSRVVQAGGHGMGKLDLPPFILEDKRLGTLEHAEGPAGKTGSMLAALDAQAAGLDAVHFYRGIIEKLIKQPHGIRPAAHAGNEAVRQPAFELRDLLLRFASDHGLEVPHHHGEGVGPEDRA